MWRKLLSESLLSNSIFDTFCLKIEDSFLSAKSHDMKELRINKDINRRKGIFFEELCVALLREELLLAKCRLSAVIPFSDLGEERLALLGFRAANGRITKQDMGIDIVAVDDQGRWYAIQCKYVKKPLKEDRLHRWQVKWQTLSTFYALCERTGPPEGWFRHVVITNARSVRRQGEKKKNDISICHGTLAAISREGWYSICGHRGYSLLGNTEKEEIQAPQVEEKKEEMLTARNAWLDKLK
jgi:hypothetical protein